MSFQWLIPVIPTALSAVAYGAMMGTCAAELVKARRRIRSAPTTTPRVSILKPLAGADDGLAENLESFARLDYPHYEIVLGVASAGDAALRVARRFVLAHPERARLVFTDRDNAINPKVAQLIDLERGARGDVIVISDSNVRVDRDYLQSLVRELEQPNVGLVTSVFAGSGEQTIGAALENLQLCAASAPGIVAMNSLTPWPITIGKSMAMRRSDFARIGGFARFGALLAEDQTMGMAFVEAGMGVRTALDPVHNMNVSCGVWRTLERHTRWAKLRRSLHPIGFLFEPLLSPLTVALLAAVADSSRLTLAIAGIVACVQTAIALATVSLVRRRPLSWKHAPLEVARTLLVFGCWLAACASMRIQWRGHPFLLKRGSYIVPAPQSTWRGLLDRARTAKARA